MPSATSPTHPDIPPFPPPQTFSILPEIYILISRLELLQQNPPTGVEATPTPALQPSTPGGTTSATLLTLQDLPDAIQPVKRQIQKARASVLALPDVERTVEQQEDEIRRLERRIASLKGRLEELGRLGREEIKSEKQDIVMVGFEG